MRDDAKANKITKINSPYIDRFTRALPFMIFNTMFKNMTSDRVSSTSPLIPVTSTNLSIRIDYTMRSSLSQ